MVVAGVFYPLGKSFTGVKQCKPAVCAGVNRQRRSAAGSKSRQHMFRV